MTKRDLAMTLGLVAALALPTASVLAASNGSPSGHGQGPARPASHTSDKRGLSKIQKHHGVSADATTTTMTASPTVAPSATATNTAQPSATATNTAQPSATATNTAQPSATTTATAEPTDTATPPVTRQCKPGHGYGDKNHCHSGPPGHRHGHKVKHHKMRKHHVRDDADATATVATSPTAVASTTATAEPTDTATPPVTRQCKPGHGYGDKNHCHSGPPGHRR